MNLKAYAKINWYLDIKGKKANGYHELEMIMQHIDLYDDLWIEKSSDPGIQLSIAGTRLLEDAASNLVVKAAKLLQTCTGTPFGANIMLKKRIPIGAGLGGGSADAAAALIGLNKLWDLKFSIKQLQDIGLQLGADIPYCLEESPAIVGGIGEKITPLDLGEELWLVLLQPQAALSTKEVFSRYHTSDRQSSKLDEVVSAIRKGKMDMIGNNSLQPAAIRMLPEISCLIGELRDNGAQFAQMSGSGSAVFGVFADQSSAYSAFSHLKSTQAMCFMCKTLKRAKSAPLDYSDGLRA